MQNQNNCHQLFIQQMRRVLNENREQEGVLYEEADDELMHELKKNFSNLFGPIDSD